MPTQLNQIIALANGTKARAAADLTVVYHMLAKEALLAGRTRHYQPRDEDGEHLPAESQRVQVRVDDALSEVAAIQTKLFDLIATQDQANTEAKAAVIVDNEVILREVPVTHLLFLEKQLTDLHTVVAKLPTLDPAYEWTYNEAADCMATPPMESLRTKKLYRNHQVAAATKEHPEQVHLYNEDLPVGTWTQVLFSGAIPASKRNAIRDRVRALRDAVVSAREFANTREVEPVKIGKSVFDFVLGVQAQS